MTGKKSLFLVFVCGALLSLCIAGPLCGQDITPALEQEFLDAKAALATAQKAQGDKYSAENMAKAQELLTAAESVRPLKDGAQFAQMSRLARAYAELAKAVAELKIDQENLAATNDDLKKVKAEIEELKKGQ
jgi:cell division protein FtsB